MRHLVLYGSILAACGGILCLAACDESSWMSKNPKGAIVIEDVVDEAEVVGETVAESELRLPAGSLKPVFDHKLVNTNNNTAAPATAQPTKVVAETPAK